MRSEREERPENRDGVPVEAGRSQSTGRLLLLLVDVVAYSRMMSIQQLQSVRLLHDVWREAGCPDAKGMFSPPRSPISIGDGFIFAGEDKASVAEAFFNYIQSLCTRLDALPQQDRFSVRFAAHSGDCWIIEDNILGSGVNDLCRFAQCAV
ncbi:MAG: hypothetical protein FJY85_17420, partial [Deltaproteobacteria bacterium]|nr:hypothetical protein [Deltaproteobacteria bacterium]